MENSRAPDIISIHSAYFVGRVHFSHYYFNTVVDTMVSIKPYLLAAHTTSDTREYLKKCQTHSAHNIRYQHPRRLSSVWCFSFNTKNSLILAVFLSWILYEKQEYISTPKIQTSLFTLLNNSLCCTIILSSVFRQSETC